MNNYRIAGKTGLRRAFKQIGVILKKGQVKSVKNKRDAVTDSSGGGEFVRSAPSAGLLSLPALVYDEKLYIFLKINEFNCRKRIMLSNVLLD